MVAIPRLVIAAPASGCGKTTVACGLMAALRARGLSVSGHKVGPDYIDPGYHALATGRAPRNLDPFLCSEDLIAPLFLHGASGAQAAVVEGVMGLFDGADPAMVPEADFGSTAHVSRLLRAPVVLVVDAARAGRSVAALAAGFAGFDPRTTVAGVILNRVGSGRHERLLREALASSGMTVYGAIRRTEAIITPSRHLGLVPAAERAAIAGHAMAVIGTLIAESCDLDGLLALARGAPDLPGPPWDPAAALPEAALPPAALPAVPVRTEGKPTVAVAAGAAFTFGYTEQSELLEAAGARVAPFDPLRDEDLPEGTAGLILGGGFPEVHAAGLSANDGLRGQVAALAATGAPMAAECAGLLYLARTLDGQPMCGVLDVTAQMTGKLTLGYRKAQAMTDSVLAGAGDWVRGHEFHRTAAVPHRGARPAWRFTSGEIEGHVTEPGSSVASYLHVHWAGYPAAAARFAAACAATKGPATKGPATKGPATKGPATKGRAANGPVR
jgi:cobyrinic acid a,c-diamide synthase